MMSSFDSSILFCNERVSIYKLFNFSSTIRLLVLLLLRRSLLLLIAATTVLLSLHLGILKFLLLLLLLELGEVLPFLELSELLLLGLFLGSHLLLLHCCHFLLMLQLSLHLQKLLLGISMLLLATISLLLLSRWQVLLILLLVLCSLLIALLTPAF